MNIEESRPAEMISNFDLRVENHAFFPRNNANANISEALEEALQLLINTPNYELADNMVVLFSDGLSNCAHNGTNYNCDESYALSLIHI